MTPLKIKIAVTGAKGTIGQILLKNLKNIEVVPIDLPEIDARNKTALTEAVADCTYLIHLAWNKKTENFRNGKWDPDNSIMAYNAYEAALMTGIKRVIISSSIHANPLSINGELIHPMDHPLPQSPYGANKVFIESLGRYFSTKGLEIVCLRFGGVNPEDRVDLPEEGYRKVWLSHRDLTDLMVQCISAEKIPNGFTIINAVSNNDGRIFNTVNPLNWHPQDNAALR